MATHGPRLASITFAPEQRRLTLADVLPRMDVAGFVGFAASGPLHEPVVVEDPLQFAAIFGPDLDLAWDPERGETVYAYLAPAVRAFFRNGGQRCWVARVPRPSGDIGTLRELALFAGFAEKGPLYRPVLVKGLKQFAEIFGAAPPAWIGQYQPPGAVVLAPLVQQFFDGGGARCLVVRLPDLDNGKTIAIRAELFLDPDLAETGAEALQAQADFLRYQSPSPRDLLGIHALMSVEEITLAAVPDAAQRGWIFEARDSERPPVPDPPPAKAPDCQPAMAVAEPGQFSPCVSLPAPQLQPIEPPNPGAPLIIGWPASDSAATYELEEASTPDFADAVVIYRGAQLRAVFDRWNEGAAFYRVRAIKGDLSSDWSNIEGVRLGSRPQATLPPPPALGSAPWLATLDVQHALLRMCAARGDLMAILSVPAGYGAQHARDHALALKLKSSAGAVAEDARARSFGALYHPWLVSRDEIDNAIRLTPPDGAICGMIARRTLARGAWVAPANQPLVGVVALATASASADEVLFSPPQPSEPLPDWRLGLQEAGVNVINQAPRGFLTLSANTLALVRSRPDDEILDQERDDPELRPINVRRLLILLRRLALRLGATYVFEPNGPAFHRQVQRGFESLLEALYLRGAFAGANAAGAFQVNVGPALNTQAALDRGQMIVELRVAPAHPMTFLTVRLVQSGDQTLLVQER